MRILNSFGCFVLLGSIQVSAFYISSPFQYSQWKSYGPGNVTWDTTSSDPQIFDLYIEYPTNITSITGREYLKISANVAASQKSVTVIACQEFPRTVQATVVFVKNGGNISLEADIYARSPSFIIDNTNPWNARVAGTKPAACNSTTSSYLISYDNLEAPFKTPVAGPKNWQTLIDRSDYALTVIELGNLAAKYQHFSFNGNYQYICRDLMADRNDSYIGIPFGFTGLDGCYRYAETIHSAEYGDIGGTVRDRIMASPYYQISGDGETAKGVWDGLGPDTAQAKTGEAHWLYGKYGIDFIKTDKGWRMWHLQFHPIFFVQPSSDWVKDALNNATDSIPPSTANGMWIYNKYGHAPDFPPYPDPYWSFADRDAYVLEPAK